MTFDLIKKKVSNGEIRSKKELVGLLNELEENEISHRNKIFNDAKRPDNSKLTAKQYFAKYNNEITDLFGNTNPSPNKKTLFRNSSYFNMQVFKGKLKEAVLLNVDIEYYHRSINNWSDMQNEKRTGNGWIATARNWMEKDKEKNKLRFVGKNIQGENPDEMKEYLSV